DMLICTDGDTLLTIYGNIVKIRFVGEGNAGRIVKVKGMSAFGADTFMVVFCTASGTVFTMEQASHDKRPVEVTVFKSDQDLVPFFGHKHHSAIVRKLVALARIRTHDSQPVGRIILRRLPHKFDSHSSHLQWVRVVKHFSQQCIGPGGVTLLYRELLRVRRKGL